MIQRASPQLESQGERVEGRTLPAQHLPGAPEGEWKRAVQRDGVLIVGEGGIPGRPSEPLLALKESLERRQRGRPQRGRSEHLDPPSATQLPEQLHRERVGQPIHAVGRIAKLELGDRTLFLDVECRHGEPHRIRTGTDQTPEHEETRAGALAQCRWRTAGRPDLSSAGSPWSAARSAAGRRHPGSGTGGPPDPHARARVSDRAHRMARRRSNWHPAARSSPPCRAMRNPARTTPTVRCPRLGAHWERGLERDGTGAGVTCVVTPSLAKAPSASSA